MQNQEENHLKNAVIPTLLAGAAVYFGLVKKGASLGDLAKEAVNRVISDQSGVKPAQQLQISAPVTRALPASSSKRKSRKKVKNNENTNHQV